MHQKVKIIKVPLSASERMPDYSANFPSMPRLYLELLENKSKVKQELVNSEYKPSLDLQKSVEGFTTDKFEGESRENFVNDKTKFDMNSDKPPNDDNRDNRDNHDDDRDKYDDDRDKYDDKHDKYSVSDKSSSSSSVKEKEDEDDLSVKLKEFLQDSNSEKNDKKSNRSENNRSGLSDKYSQKNFVEPPTLQELHAQGKFQPREEMMDVNYINDDTDKKRELLFKFDLLRKSYPMSKSKIPEEFTLHSNYNDMQKEYDATVRKLSLDANVDSYKTYLIYAFMITEYVLGHFLNFDMEGYTQQQIVNINSYERLLIELGEKSYTPEGSNYPVELRLIFLIIFNAAVFIVGKMIMRKTGANLMNMMNNMNNNSNTSAQVPSSAPKRKKKMTGPTINFDDIENQSADA